MKRLSFLLALIAFISLGALSTQAQNVDKILANYYKKMGGLDNIKNIKTLKANARMVQQGAEIPLVLVQKKPNKQRIDMEFQGQKFSQSYNGKEGWTVNPFIQVMEPKMLTEEELKEVEDQSTIDDPLMDYKKKGHTIELEGTETIEGIDYDKIKLTKKNGNIHYYLLSKGDSMQVVVRRTILGGPMKGQTGESILGDYRAAGEGLMPYSITSKLQGQTFLQIKIDSYEINPAIDDALFDFPTK